MLNGLGALILGKGKSHVQELGISIGLAGHSLRCTLTLGEARDFRLCNGTLVRRLFLLAFYDDLIRLQILLGGILCRIGRGSRRKSTGNAGLCSRFRWWRLVEDGGIG